MLEGQRILVTGGTGLVGRAIVGMLLKRGAIPTIVTRGSPVCGASVVEADISRPDWVARVCSDARFDSIVYLAYQQTTDAAADRRVTFEGLANAVTAFDPKRVVYASTIGVFGDSPAEGVYDELSEKRPSTAYSHDKCAGRDFLASLPDVRGTVFYLSNVYSDEGGRVDSYRTLLNQNWLVLPRGGRGLYNIVHVDDIAAAVITSLERQEAGLREYVLSSEALPFREWIDYIERRFGLDRHVRLPAVLAPVARGPLRRLLSRLGRVPARLPAEKEALFERRVVYSSALARAELEWRPRGRIALDLSGDHAELSST